MFRMTTSSTQRLAKIAAFIREAPQRLPELVARETEREIMPAIQEGFNRRQDPYGVSWPKPKAGNPPLERTGRGRRSYQVIRSRRGTRWVVMVMNLARAERSGVYYMGILQAGYVHWRSRMMQVPRRQVPDTQRLPPRWADRLRSGARRADRVWRSRMP